MLVGTKNIVHVTENSFGDQNSENILIHGNNQQALLFLKPKFIGKIKCIYIDPPYNNGESYNHYTDKMDHKSWLEEISHIVCILHSFLSTDGSIWISIDDTEMHYLKVALDKIFGRDKFIATIVWQHRTTRENRSIFSNNQEYILVYAKDPKVFKDSRNLLPLTSEVKARYKNPDNDPRGSWQSISANVQSGHGTANQFYKLIAPNGKIHLPPNGRCWVYNKQRMNKEIENNNIWFGIDGNSVPRIKKFLNGSTFGLIPETLWLAENVGTSKSAKKHLLSMFPDDKIFDTPKPEQLMKRILEIGSNEGDFILDCYLGSGSTISAAHKMNRNYIGIEIGDHILNLVVERMKMVINGEPGGISDELGWNGGGGFNFYKI